MDTQHPTLAKIADLRHALSKDKEGVLASVIGSERREAAKTHMTALIDDLKWIVERMGDDAP